MRYGLRTGLALIIAALVLCVCVCICAFVSVPVVAERDTASDGLAAYDGEIEHIFTHELVFDTGKAFAASNKLRHCFDKDHLTAREFGGLLDALYTRGYVLVSLDSVISDAPLMLPEGKKPIVLSFDDMTYDTVGRGCIDKLIICDGRICDYTQTAEPQVTRERENVAILESFIEAHPDFSVGGGRATLCVNGYNGILGYRVTPDCRVSEKYMTEETAACKAFVAELKARGYTFASHTYYHSYFNSTSAAQLEKDCRMWEKYIAPIVGDTRVLCYPAGEHNAKSDKNGVLKAHGFDTFLCVGSRGATEFENAEQDARYIYRRPFDGTALRLYGKLYAHLVDTKSIYDPARFRPFSYKGGYR